MAANVYKMASVESTRRKDCQSGFSFLSIFDQNTLLKISRANRKCVQECSSGKKWVLNS